MNAAATTKPDTPPRKKGRPKSGNQPKKSRVLLKDQLDAKYSAKLKGFEQLPDCAMVANGLVAALHNISMPTYWKWVAKNRLPKPVKTDGVSRVNVGELRRFLAAKAAPPPVATVADTPPWSR